MDNRQTASAAVSLGVSAACAALSVFCGRTGFFSFFFLLPLGFAAFWGGAQTAWACGITAVAVNLIISFSLYIYRSGDPVFLQWRALYFSVMVLVFTWINAPLTRFTAALDIPYRIIAGALVCAFVMGPAFLSLAGDPRMHELVAGQLAALSGSAPSGDFSVPAPEELLSSVVYAGLRGGILAVSMIFLWVNRQIAAGIVRILRRSPARENLLAFHVPPVLIWILSLSLGAVLAGRLGEMELLDIAGWNILVISATLYFVQGGGIALYFLLKAPPLVRMFANVGIIVLFFAPGVNAAALGLLVLLGIAENWVPFRAPKQ
ncbi:MAG: YybS family protein [Treponema sp.]|nr:YybS family protein [Treponema sp.]